MRYQVSRKDGHNGRAGNGGKGIGTIAKQLGVVCCSNEYDWVQNNVQGIITLLVRVLELKGWFTMCIWTHQVVITSRDPELAFPDVYSTL
jgi:hypothetical protein